MVSDCVFGSGHGVSIGSPTSGGISGMTVQPCQYIGTSFGIRIKTARDRGGEITNLVYDDLQMTNVGNAIYFTAYYPDIPKAGADPTPMLVTATTPNLHDIVVSNVTATGGRHAGVLIGVPESGLDGL
jgi:polygalacturonase